MLECQGESNSLKYGGHRSIVKKIDQRHKGGKRELLTTSREKSVQTCKGQEIGMSRPAHNSG